MSKKLSFFREHSDFFGLGTKKQPCGLVLMVVVGGLLKYGLDCVRYDMKFPSRRNKRKPRRLTTEGTEKPS